MGRTLLFILLAALIAIAAMWLIDVDVTGDTELPDVEVEQERETATVPDVDIEMQEEEFTYPDVDVAPPEDDNTTEQ